MHTPMAFLRQKGVRIISYIDDLFIIADTREDCEYSVALTCDLLQHLGFLINVGKSSMVPSNTLTFLGFVLDANQMKVFPTQEKISKTSDFINEVLQGNVFKIRTVASLVGILNDLVKGTDYGSAHIKGLEVEKNLCVQLAGPKGYKGQMSIGVDGRND